MFLFTNIFFKNVAAANMPCENSPVIVGAEEASPHP